MRTTAQLTAGEAGRKTTAITCLFLDIGGVLLTNGWDHLARRRAAKHFDLSWAEMEKQSGAGRTRSKPPV